MASNQGALLDEFGEDDDWIEIYNNGATDVDMAGLYFTDNLDDPARWQIPAGFPETTTIGAKEYLVFYADGNPLQGPLHLDFKLSSAGEAIGLSFFSGPSVQWIDSIRYGPQVTDVSYGRFPDGSTEWLSMNRYTPQNSNIQTASPLFLTGEPEIELFPNPASEKLFVRIRNAHSMLSDEIMLNVYDLTGRKVLRDQRSSLSDDLIEIVDVSLMPEGIYILVVETGPVSFSRKFIKGHL